MDRPGYRSAQAASRGGLGLELRLSGGCANRSRREDLVRSDADSVRRDCAGPAQVRDGIPDEPVSRRGTSFEMAVDRLATSAGRHVSYAGTLRVAETGDWRREATIWTPLVVCGGQSVGQAILPAAAFPGGFFSYVRVTFRIIWQRVVNIIWHTPRPG